MVLVRSGASSDRQGESARSHLRNHPPIAPDAGARFAVVGEISRPKLPRDAFGRGTTLCRSARYLDRPRSTRLASRPNHEWKRTRPACEDRSIRTGEVISSRPDRGGIRMRQAGPACLLDFDERSGMPAVQYLDGRRQSRVGGRGSPATRLDRNMGRPFRPRPSVGHLDPAKLYHPVRNRSAATRAQCDRAQMNRVVSVCPPEVGCTYKEREL